MPRREEERNRRTDDLYYCVFCRQYLGPKDWAIHPHNPGRSKGIRRAGRSLLAGLRRRIGL